MDAQGSYPLVLTKREFPMPAEEVSDYKTSLAKVLRYRTFNRSENFLILVLFIYFF